MSCFKTTNALTDSPNSSSGILSYQSADSGAGVCTRKEHSQLAELLWAVPGRVPSAHFGFIGALWGAYHQSRNQVSSPSAKPVQASVGHRALPSGYVALPTGSTPVPAQGSNRWSHRTSGVVETVSRATTAPTLISAGSAKPAQGSRGHRGLPLTRAYAYRCCRMFRVEERYK